MTTATSSPRRFSDLLDEVHQARIYGGMHYRNSCEQGSKLGKKVVRNLAQHFFRPSHGDDEGGDNESEDD